MLKEVRGCARTYLEKEGLEHSKDFVLFADQLAVRDARHTSAAEKALTRASIDVLGTSLPMRWKETGFTFEERQRITR